MTRPPSAPGAAGPASCQARCRAAARARRIALSARGASPGQRGNQPGDDRARSDRAEQLRLGAQHRRVGQAVAARRDHDCEVQDGLAGVVHRSRCPPPRQARRQPGIQARHPGGAGEEQRAAAGHQPGAVSGYLQGRPQPGIVHVKSASALARTGPSTSPILPVQGHFLIQIARPGAYPREMPRLKPTEDIGGLGSAWRLMASLNSAVDRLGGPEASWVTFIRLICRLPEPSATQAPARPRSAQSRRATDIRAEGCGQPRYRRSAPERPAGCFCAYLAARAGVELICRVPGRLPTAAAPAERRMRCRSCRWHLWRNIGYGLNGLRLGSPDACELP
jgi:hypothetical protein